MDSSKIKKDIRAIMFVSDTKTVITFNEKFTPNQHNKAVKETHQLISNMDRHEDFNRAMAKMKVHLMVRSQFAEPVDRLGLPIQQAYFADHIFEDDERFKGIDVKGIIFTTKDDTTSFQILGTKTTTDGEIIQLKSPVISTIKLPDGVGVYNYPLLVLGDEHKETLLLEALEFKNYKSSALTLFNSATVTQLTPKQKQEEAKKAQAEKLDEAAAV